MYIKKRDQGYKQLELDFANHCKCLSHSCNIAQLMILKNKKLKLNQQHSQVESLFSCCSYWRLTGV